MKLRIAFLSIAFFPLLSIAQVAMGGWRSHFAYNQTNKVEQTASKIFGVADGALFSVSKEDNSVETYSKIDGLNDFSISKIKYNETLGVLMIAYADGNIDLLSSDGISNIPDIKEKNVTANKIPKDIFFVNEYAYISNGIGIVVVNLKKKEITDTYIVGNNGKKVSIMSTTIFGDSIYAIDSTGVHVALSSNKFLADYENWKYRTNTPLPSAVNLQLVVFNNKLYLLKSSGAVYSSSDAVNWTPFDNSQTYTGIKVSDNNLLLHASKSIVKYNQNLAKESFSDTTTNDVIYNSNTSAYWIAADSAGLVKVINGAITQTFKPDGPTSNNIFNMKYEGDRIFAITAAPWDYDMSIGTIPGAVMIYENNSWKNIINKDVKPYTKVNFMGLTYMAADKSDKTHFYVSTWGEGLYEFRNDAFYKRYNYTNSTIEYAFSANPDLTQNLDGVCIDKNNNIWMSDEQVSNSLKILQKDGTWSQLSYPELAKRASFDKIIATQNNFKWLNLPGSTGGLFVLDDKGITTSTSGHSKRFFPSVTDQDGNVISIQPVYCMVEDSDKNVWIGTANGPIIFENIDNVFNSDYTINRPKISRNDGTDYADYLLNGTKINCLVVDGANRKWIGTGNSGVFLMSSDGLSTIHHFTAENSPLLSNNILSMAVDSKTGETFFATDEGLISYMSDATEAQSSYSSISVYPNPVRENFSGVITITGLMSGTTIKITDTAGNLIYTTKSNGGIATWDGQNISGKRVNTGVYFVMASNATDSNSSDIKTAIAKILIIK
ncbi:MAG: two-component regulator propeller domain-containing protein [Paludibacteraceae bacterium]|nr:two-component regulator propeller domain-containing protein [Paludibacteraceae bacterium]